MAAETRSKRSSWRKLEEIQNEDQATGNDEHEDHLQEFPAITHKERKISWAKLRRIDSLNLEAGLVSKTQGSAHHQTHPGSGGQGSTSATNWRRTLSFAFQSIGVVYGDIGTSPLYVFKSTFTEGIKTNDDILGVLSLIIYTILFVALIKYVAIVLWANDNGDGGTFALYSLLCRHLRVSLIPNNQPEDAQLSNYNLELPSRHATTRLAHYVKTKMETKRGLQMLMFVITILGTSMVIGDGILTPSISVLSAVEGLSSSLGKEAVVGISVAILIVLFSVQRFGSDKVGLSFAPIIMVWFAFIAGIGAYNLFKHDVTVLRAINPKYIVDYFTRNGKHAWISLGGIVLCITGAEAMFADLGHFNVRAIQISFAGFVCPALTIAYLGQAAYLSKFPEDVQDTFYKSIPGGLYWPTFVVAVAAAIIASQAMISGAFAIVSQSLSLGCFPRVKVVHTSAKYEGQVYIPEINYMLMIACVLVTVAFQTTEQIGHAYGIAVVAVMVITTCMISLIMLVIWKTRLYLILLFFTSFMAVEIVYLSAVLYKFKQGGYLPLAFSVFLMMVMGTWHYVHKQRYMYELKNKVSPEYIPQLMTRNDHVVSRVPGMAFLYSELVQGIPPIFPHFVANVPSVHSVLVFVSLKNLPISKVLPEERFLFRQVEPREYRMFRCVVRYGYKDTIEEPQVFERQLVQNLKEFIRHEHFINEAPPPPTDDQPIPNDGSSRHVSSRRSSNNSIRAVNNNENNNTVTNNINNSNGISNGAEEEMQFVQKAMEKGVVYLLGEAEVVAEPNSSLLKKFVVNYGYSFLRKNFRGGEKGLAVPRTRLLRVGMTYEI
ncbi:Potassium transporter 5 [Linum perenne]